VVLEAECLNTQTPFSLAARNRSYSTLCYHTRQITPPSFSRHVHLNKSLVGYCEQIE
jgi:hypothetical protein